MGSKADVNVVIASSNDRAVFHFSFFIHSFFIHKFFSFTRASLKPAAAEESRIDGICLVRIDSLPLKTLP